MSFRFTRRDDGIIEAHVASGEGVLDHALNDAVSSRAPRGASHQGLSTYWIDHAKNALRHAKEHGLDGPFASGNVTYLRLDRDRVVAGYEFDPDEDEAETLPVEEFLALLAEWRRLIIEAGGASGDEAMLMSEQRKPRPMGGKVNDRTS